VILVGRCAAGAACPAGDAYAADLSRDGNSYASPREHELPHVSRNPPMFMSVCALHE